MGGPSLICYVSECCIDLPGHFTQSAGEPDFLGHLKKTPEQQYYYERGYKAPDVALAIIGAGLANAIALLGITGPYSFWNTIVGFIILCILVAYTPWPSSRRSLKVAFVTIFSISLLSTIGVLFNILFDAFGGKFPDYNAVCFRSFPVFQRQCNPHPSDMPESIFSPFNAYDLWFFGTWIALSIICYWFFFSGGKKELRVLLQRIGLNRSQKHNSE